MPAPISLMIIGAQKAATTSLGEYLGQHPQICTHPQREMMFFVDDRLYAEGYERIFPAFFGSFAPGQAILAKCVDALTTPAAPARLRAHNPDMRLAVVLRDPVDRAYSAFWYARRKGIEEIPDFENAIALEPKRAERDVTKARYCSYVGNGLYHKHLSRVLEHFPADRLHIVLQEDLQRDAARQCSRLFEAVGVDAAFVPDTAVRLNEAAAARSAAVARLANRPMRLKSLFSKMLPVGAVVWLRWRLARLNERFNERAFRPPPLPAQTRARLMPLFEDDMKALERSFGLDLSGWRSLGGRRHEEPADDGKD